MARAMSMGQEVDTLGANMDIPHTTMPKKMSVFSS